MCLCLVHVHFSRPHASTIDAPLLGAAAVAKNVSVAFHAPRTRPHNLDGRRGSRIPPAECVECTYQHQHHHVFESIKGFPAIKVSSRCCSQREVRWQCGDRQSSRAGSGWLLNGDACSEMRVSASSYVKGKTVDVPWPGRQN